MAAAAKRGWGRSDPAQDSDAGPESDSGIEPPARAQKKPGNSAQVPTAAVAEPRVRIVPGGLVITVPVEIAAAASLRVPHGKNEERGNFRIDTSE
jgi:hypothetical protein